MKRIQVKQELKNNYEDYYENDISEWRRLGALGKADNIIKLCNGINPSNILEIGAGDGSLLMRLAELNFSSHAHALEISSSGVAAISNKGIPNLVDCRLYDGYNIPYDNAIFDVVILSHVVEHVEHPRQLLYEAARVAKFVVVEVPCEDTIRLSNDYTFDSVGHINFYSPKTFKRLVQTCGFDVLEMIVTNLPKEVYIYQKGRGGLVSYYTKASLLFCLPQVAVNIFTYHAALIFKGRES